MSHQLFDSLKTFDLGNQAEVEFVGCRAAAGGEGFRDDRGRDGLGDRDEQHFLRPPAGPRRRCGNARTHPGEPLGSAVPFPAAGHGRMIGARGHAINPRGRRRIAGRRGASNPAVRRSLG